MSQLKMEKHQLFHLDVFLVFMAIGVISVIIKEKSEASITN
ncbi:MAG: hypothetical protein ACFE9Q_13410 [Candidatus Hodarchaeota archaeon]